jgi:hypothetical protein
MPNRIVLKKSSVSSKVPLAGDLEYGELALNYTDEKLYFKNAANAIKSFNVTQSTLTIGTGLSGTSYNGTSAVTVAIDSTVATLTGTQTLTNKTIAASNNTISGLTNSNLSGTAGITNANLANSSVTIGSTAIALGASATTIAGLTSVTSTGFTGALTGNASTATTLQTARTINGVSFNGSANITVTANTTNALTIGTGLSGTSFNGSGAVTIAIDSTVATLTGTQTLTNKTLTSPRVGTGIFDTNGNEVLNIVPVASAVNELSISNAATGGSVLLSTAGTDANINLLIQTKGTGSITLDTGTGAGFIDLKPGTDNIRFYDDDSSHYYRLVTGNRTANYDITLPDGSVTLTAGTSVVTTRSISTTAPLAGGGDLSANRTLSLAAGYGDTQNPYASKTANNFLAAPNGTAGVPTFRAIVAADIPTLNQNTTGSAATLTTTRTLWGQNFNGSANVTGALSSVTTLSMTGQLTNTVATGTAPLAITSTTRVANLNVATAGTADTLTTARTINTVSFNGSANIVVEPFVESDESTNATRYITFVDSSTDGHQRLNEKSNFTINPSTGTVITPGAFASTFALNKNTIDVSYSIPSGYNAVAAGPVVINNGITVTIPDGSTWVIV